MQCAQARDVAPIEFTQRKSRRSDRALDGVPCPPGSAWLGFCDLEDGIDVMLSQAPIFVIANLELAPRGETIFANRFDS